MQIKVADQSFTVSHAVICAYVIDPKTPLISINGVQEQGIFWDLRVEAGGEHVHFWHESIEIPNLTRWTDLVGRSAKWDSPINEITGEMNGGWYGGNFVSAHLEILHSQLHFTEREQCRIHLEWKGVCSSAPLECQPNVEERLPFSIDCWCIFEGVGETKREVIARYLNVSDFAEVFSETPSSVSGRTLLKPIC